MAETQKIVEYKTVTVAWCPVGACFHPMYMPGPMGKYPPGSEGDALVAQGKAKQLPGYKGYEYTSPLDEAINLLLVQGWQPHGPASMIVDPAGSHPVVHTQTMVKVATT